MESCIKGLPDVAAFNVYPVPSVGEQALITVIVVATILLGAVGLVWFIGYADRRGWI